MMKKLLTHPLFGVGLGIRLLMIVTLLPQAAANWYAPFLDHALSAPSLDPWGAFLQDGGNPAAFPYGYVTTNDDWQNYWRTGINTSLGWDSNLSGKGTGAKTMGMELAHSKAFASYQVEKVFKHVCLRKPANATDHGKIDAITASFASSGYKLKQVFIDTADYCKGE